MQHIQFLLFILVIAGCAPQKKDVSPSNAFLPGKRLAELTHKKLDEVSGLAASIANPGLLWTQNDSGNDAEVFLIDTKLEIRQTFVLQGVKNRDWEDITVGPGPDSTKHYVYVADIGDNFAVFPFKYVYRFEEPVFHSGEKKITITNFETLTIRLSDAKRDAEALFIDPVTKDLFIISKWKQPVFIYQVKYPYSTHDTLTAQNVGSVPFSQIVAADISEDGREILMKNYNHVYYWKSASQETVLELLKHDPVEVPYQVEPQGEAITWAADNSGFYTLSEKSKDKKSFLYFYQRQ